MIICVLSGMYSLVSDKSLKKLHLRRQTRGGLEEYIFLGNYTWLRLARQGWLETVQGPGSRFPSTSVPEQLRQSKYESKIQSPSYGLINNVHFNNLNFFFIQQNNSYPLSTSKSDILFIIEIFLNSPPTSINKIKLN